MKKLPIVILSSSVGLLVLSVAVQLAYPRSWMLPVTRLGSKTYFFANRLTVNDYIASLTKQTVIIKTAGKTYTSSWKDLGISYDTNAIIKQASNYPTPTRLIPFSLVWVSLEPRQLSTKVDDIALGLYAQRISEENYAKATDAGLKAENGTLALIPQQTGKEYAPATSVNLIRSAVAKGHHAVDLKLEIHDPAVTDADMRPLIVTAQKQVDAGLTIEGGAKLTPNRTTLASWYRVSTDAATKKPKTTLDGDAIQGYIKSVEKDFYVAPGNTVVAIVDGKEASRTAGTPGWGIDAAGAGPLILAAMNEGRTSVTLKRVSLAPKVTYTKSYSNSQAGLQALLDYLVSTKGTYGIAVQEIGGRGWSANSAGTKQFVTASTYKLFVAYSTLKRIDSGVYTWADPTSGTDLTTCFRRMIVDSDNPCAEALGARIGWNTVISEMHGLGLNATSHTDTFHSNANDEALLLGKLARGEILTSGSRDTLIGLMKQQRFRTGIPKGTGVPVADKVGFLWSYLHDAAIVYAPKSTYVLVILTSGSSWAQIADTARQINAQMSR